jgi:hypothetical protein
MKKDEVGRGHAGEQKYAYRILIGKPQTKVTTCKNKT